MQIIDAMEELEEMERLGLLQDKIVLQMMDSTGDTKMVWDVNDEDDVENARVVFAKARSQGKTIFRVNAAGEPGEVMTEFEPKAGKFVAAPRMRGG